MCVWGESLVVHDNGNQGLMIFEHTLVRLRFRTPCSVGDILKVGPRKTGKTHTYGENVL